MTDDAVKWLEDNMFTNVRVGCYPRAMFEVLADHDSGACSYMSLGKPWTEDDEHRWLKEGRTPWG